MRAQIIGIGTIGGSIATALRLIGWNVTADDISSDRLKLALDDEIIDAIGIDPDAEVTFIATPVPVIAEQAKLALERGGVVTDVGSVKGSVIQAVSHPHFVGGHPMAGSERSGLDGVNPELFRGATWVLTPDEHTDPEVYLKVRNIVTALGATVVTLPAAEHDEIVATVSHVPHLVASLLMNLAMERRHSHEALLRLAAGGFRDMTRIAAGHPELWTGITVQNREAIVKGLAELSGHLDVMREHIANSNDDEVRKLLTEAAVARNELPRRGGRPIELSLLRIPIPDTPGAMGRVFALFGEMKVNIEDINVLHDPRGDRGTLEIAVASGLAELCKKTLTRSDFTVVIENLASRGK